MQVPQLVYCLGALAFIYYLTSKAENKWFLSAILFWLFSTPILGDQYYPMSFHFGGIDLQPNRILFLFLSAMLCFFIIRARVDGRNLLEFTIHQFRFYELWIVVYIGIAILSVVLNFNALGAQLVVVIVIKLVTFLLVYFFARECISLQDFRLLAVAIVTFAILSSLVGVYQFIGDSSFFRIGVSRIAFGSYIRGNGFFTSEYDQGVFLTTALIIGLLIVQSKWGKAFVVAILPLGVFFTMHRASWGILAVACVIIAIREFRRTYLWIFQGAIVVILVLFAVLNIPMQRGPETFLEKMINLRIQDNTLDVRLDYNQFAMDMIRKYPLGLGDYSSTIYGKEAYKSFMDFLGGSPLIIHNGYLSAGVLYGVAGMISFTLLIIFTLIHYLQKEFWSTNIGLMVVLIVISFAVINLTQDFSNLGNQINIFLGLLLGAALSLNSHFRASLPMPVQKTIQITQPKQAGT